MLTHNLFIILYLNLIEFQKLQQNDDYSCQSDICEYSCQPVDHNLSLFLGGKGVRFGSKVVQIKTK